MLDTFEEGRIEQWSPDRTQGATPLLWCCFSVLIVLLEGPGHWDHIPGTATSPIRRMGPEPFFRFMLSIGSRQTLQEERGEVLKSSAASKVREVPGEEAATGGRRPAGPHDPEHGSGSTYHFKYYHCTYLRLEGVKYKHVFQGCV